MGSRTESKTAMWEWPERRLRTYADVTRARRAGGFDRCRLVANSDQGGKRDMILQARLHPILTSRVGLGGCPPRPPTDPDLWSKKLISSHLLDLPPRCL